jgi:hypothetical protein
LLLTTQPLAANWGYGNGVNEMSETGIIAAEQTAIATTDYGTGLLEVIARAARDPSVDIDKMERLIAMQERVQARDAEIAFNQALNKSQMEMRPIAANASNPQTKSRYATFDKLDRVLRPIYTEHGFSLSFDEGETDKPDHVRVLCYVAHIGGHTRTYHRDMPADGKGAKGGDVMTKTHAAGAAGSYGARYLLKGIFNVAVGEEDDDGNVSRPAKPGPVLISDSDIAMIEQYCKALGGTTQSDLLTAYKVSAIPDLTTPQAKAIITRLQDKVAAAAKAETDAKAAQHG